MLHLRLRPRPHRRRWPSCVAGLALLLAAGCGGGDGGGSGGGGGGTTSTRSHWIGFSPWPYDATQEAVDWTWTTLRAEGDIVSHHIEEGVPWPQAASGVNATWPVSFQQNLSDRRTRAAGRKVLLQISPLNLARDGMALLRDENLNQPLPTPWSGYALDSPQVKAAFTNYALRMVNELQPDVLLTGIEVNLLATQNPARWAAYLALQCHVYGAVKALHPNLPLGVSAVTVALLPEYASEHTLSVQQQALEQLAPCVDWLAWSSYPFMSALLADSLPANYFDLVIARTPAAMRSKPMGFSESGYPAQAFTSGTLTFNGTPAKQREFVRLMLRAAEQYQMRFVVWYAMRDYDALWAGALNRDPLALIWRDTGLFDEAGTAREALTEWRERAARTWRAPS